VKKKIAAPAAAQKAALKTIAAASHADAAVAEFRRPRNRRCRKPSLCLARA